VSRVVYVFALALLACVDDSAPVDPLDPDLIRTISMAQGSASADTHSGVWQLVFEVDNCDCPSVELEDQLVDLCSFASFAGPSYEAQLIESGGLLAIPAGFDASFGVLSGAIDADGGFSVASRHDASTVAGPLELLARMDGQFDGDQVEGWAGQRLIGELASAQLDCRWIGSFVGTRL
jgi:hypothetical protein